MQACTLHLLTASQTEAINRGLRHLNVPPTSKHQESQTGTASVTEGLASLQHPANQHIVHTETQLWLISFDSPFHLK